MAFTAVENFLASLAFAIAGDAELSLAKPRDLFVFDAVEADAADVYTVLRIYGGEEPGNFANMRYPVASIQADTRGFAGAGVLKRAWQVHETLLDSSNRPWLDRVIAGKKFDDAGEAYVDDPGVSWVVWVKQFTGMPGIRGRDESDRQIATDSFDVRFYPKAA